MKHINFIVSEGCQNYLYNVTILAKGFEPITICEDCFFAEVIDSLTFLLDPRCMNFIEDETFAQHMLNITKTHEYVFNIPTWDVADYLHYHGFDVKETNTPIIEQIKELVYKNVITIDTARHLNEMPK